MSRVGTDLPGLQNLIKRDPIMYHEEFLQQVVLVVLMSKAVRALPNRVGDLQDESWRACSRVCEPGQFPRSRGPVLSHRRCAVVVLRVGACGLPQHAV